LGVFITRNETVVLKGNEDVFWTEYKKQGENQKKEERGTWKKEHPEKAKETLSKEKKFLKKKGRRRGEKIVESTRRTEKKGNGAKLEKEGTREKFRKEKKKEKCF